MNDRILVTGSSGLVGSALSVALASRGATIKHLDIAASGRDHGDVRQLDHVRQAAEGCDGIVHLAAVSRVIWGERDPEFCWATNVDGLRNVLEVASSAPKRPWVIFASSREVYGQPEKLPADEDCPPRPVNIYGRSKVEGERLIEVARTRGIRACTVRLSNVFGRTSDHADRVVPAFARGAALGQELRVDGAAHMFDFTHIDDVANGIATLARLLASGQAPPPPIHLVSGTPTTLDRLAKLAIQLAGTEATIRYAPPRNFDVARFVGSNRRARTLLGWTPRVSLEEGLTTLIQAFRRALEPSIAHEAAT